MGKQENAANLNKRINTGRRLTAYINENERQKSKQN